MIDIAGIARRLAKAFDASAAELLGRQKGDRARRSRLLVWLCIATPLAAGVLPLLASLRAPASIAVPVAAILAVVPVAGLALLFARQSTGVIVAALAILAPTCLAGAILAMPEAGLLFVLFAIVAQASLASLASVRMRVAAFGLLAVPVTATAANEMLVGRTDSFDRGLLLLATAFSRRIAPGRGGARGAYGTPAITRDTDWTASRRPLPLLRVNAEGAVCGVAEPDTPCTLPLADIAKDGLLARIHLTDKVAVLQTIRIATGDRVAAICEARIRTSADNAPAGEIRYRWHALSAMPFAADGAPQCVLSLADCDDLHRERDSGAALAERIAEAEIGKDRFLAAVSHELRTPLNAIIGFSDILHREMFGAFNDPRQKEYAKLIHESGTHLLTVVNLMLDVSRLQAGQYHLASEHFAIKPLVEECVVMLALEARRKEIHLAERALASVGEGVADRRAVKQILINLLANAIKFTEKGGCVTVDASREAGATILTVSDTGIGMSAEELARIGRPFVQIDGDYARRREGAGLGLYLVKGLAELHSGTMDIRSEQGVGTMVTVTIPDDAKAGIPQDAPAIARRA